LINGYLRCDRFCVGSSNLGVEPVVEIVPGRSMVKESENGKSDKARNVESTLDDEKLTMNKNEKSYEEIRLDPVSQ